MAFEIMIDIIPVLIIDETSVNLVEECICLMFLHSPSDDWAFDSNITQHLYLVVLDVSWNSSAIAVYHHMQSTYGFK